MCNADISEDELWELLIGSQNQPFQTYRGLSFFYTIRGYEMFVSRKDKSITRATIMIAFHKAQALMASEGKVKGPKKLGTFGASYIYVIFEALGILHR